MKKVALIYGGEGYERGISIRSAENLYRLIDNKQYEIIPVFISSSGGWYIGAKEPFGKFPTLGAHPTYPVRLHGNSGFLCADGILRVDTAIPLLHGDFGEDGKITGALDCAHIRYIGNSTEVGAVCADKCIAKIIAKNLGIKTARWVCDTSQSPSVFRKTAEDAVGYPMFIKPALLGSSYGASPVFSREEFESAYSKAKSMCCKVMAEELIATEKEVECAFLEIYGKRHFFAGTNIKTNGNFYSYGAKYNGEYTPEISHGTKIAKENSYIEKSSQELADAIGLKDIARIDFLVGRDGEAYFNEINTVPGMTESSMYARMTEDMGFAHGEFINALLAAE